ncbi:hypothetical protein [Polyangium sp. y55x31]|uniref:hypothetical protein n=1 Tax=Polyangium sp. y55x31 TaxID=3042688 RepID=UPI0024827AFE|nr:hypothetical protein [Polyangium sp. y55x31]MDI1483908.1 hypothetical protein [Polyangium sp. y55x31]
MSRHVWMVAGMIVLTACGGTVEENPSSSAQGSGGQGGTGGVGGTGGMDATGGTGGVGGTGGEGGAGAAGGQGGSGGQGGDACEPGHADCDGNAANGCEVDTQVDPAHCGACGAACTATNGTPGCSAGSCVIAACDPGRSDCDDDPSNGCEVAGSCMAFPIASGLGRITNLAVDDTYVYVLGHYDNDRITRIQKTPPYTATTLYTASSFMVDIHVVGSDLYWTDYSAGTLSKAPLAGGGPIQTVASGFTSIGAVLIEPTRHVWTIYAGTGGLNWTPIGGGATTTLGTIPGNYSGGVLMLPGGDYLITSQSSQYLFRIPSGGGAATQEYDLGPGRVSTQLAEDTSAFYTATYGSEVLRVDKTTKAVTVVASGQPQPVGVAVDAKHVYWGNYFGGDVWAVHK